MGRTSARVGLVLTAVVGQAVPNAAWCRITTDAHDVALTLIWSLMKSAGRTSSVVYKLEMLAERCSSYSSQAITRNTMAWTLEARFALAALVLTFIMSGVGLLLKYHRCMPHLRNSKASLLQVSVEGIIRTCACKSATHTARS